MDTEELTPGKGGADCLYNGLHEGYECACDECDFYLECYPDWRKFGECSAVILCVSGLWQCAAQHGAAAVSCHAGRFLPQYAARTAFGRSLLFILRRFSEFP